MASKAGLLKAIRNIQAFLDKPLPPIDLHPERALSIPVPVETQQRVRELMSQGLRLEAIKEIREATPHDLKDCRDAAHAIHMGLPVPTR